MHGDVLLQDMTLWNITGTRQASFIFCSVFVSTREVGRVDVYIRERVQWKNESVQYVLGAVRLGAKEVRASGG